MHHGRNSKSTRKERRAIQNGGRTLDREVKVDEHPLTVTEMT